MKDAPKAHFHLEPDLRKSAEAGTHPFIAKMVKVLDSARFRVEFRDHGDDRDGDDAFSLTHMKEPRDARGLTFRRV